MDKERYEKYISHYLEWRVAPNNHDEFEYTHNLDILICMFQQDKTELSMRDFEILCQGHAPKVKKDFMEEMLGEFSIGFTAKWRIKDWQVLNGIDYYIQKWYKFMMKGE